MDDWCSGDNDDEEEKEQQNEKEGKSVRQLFRTDSDSSEDTIMIPENEGTEDGLSSEKLTTIVRKILNVELEESVVGGSIEHRLWPAAEYLASFVLKMCHDPSMSPTVVSPIFDPAFAVSATKACSTNQTSAAESSQDAFGTLMHLLHTSDATTKADSFLLDHVDDPNDDHSKRKLCILELGSGVGLTGLALAMQLSNLSSILLTDLESALPLLRSNVKRNPRTKCPVQVSRLEWGNPQDLDHVLNIWYKRQSCTIHSSSSLSPLPMLILGSDCVYWEHLYEPLERTIAGLLQQAPCDSMCLLAGMRRWKRDNHFYRHVLGKVTVADGGRLRCTCIDEQVLHSNSSSSNKNKIDHRPERQVMRIYAIQWIRTDPSKK